MKVSSLGHNISSSDVELVQNACRLIEAVDNPSQTLADLSTNRDGLPRRILRRRHAA